MTALPTAITPRELAALIAAHDQMQVIGLDVDGVLAPIAAHADHARLLPGIAELLTRLGAARVVAVVSGRSLADLETRYSFPAEVEVIGSHGLESRRAPHLHLTPAESAHLNMLRAAVDAAVDLAGKGAWREDKPASVVLHTRLADTARATDALAGLHKEVTQLPGTHVTSGHEVMEVMVRPGSKAAAMEDLRRRHGALCITFIGDDLTDEEVFASCGPNDITVRVGEGASCARYRLVDPTEVRTALEHLEELLDITPCSPDPNGPSGGQNNLG